MIHVTQQKPPVPKPPLRTRVLVLRLALSATFFTLSFWMQSDFPEVMMISFLFCLYYVIRLFLRILRVNPFPNFRARLSYLFHYDPHRLLTWIKWINVLFGTTSFFSYFRLFYLWAYGQTGTPEYYFWLVFGTITFCIAFGAFCFMSYLYISGKLSRPRDTHGSAHFADLHDMEGAGM